MITTQAALRDCASTLFRNGIEAADSNNAVLRCLKASQDRLEILLDNAGQKRTGNWPKIHLIAFGKAACPMIKAALEVIPHHRLGRAIAVTNYENLTAIDGVTVLGASHPLPDEAGYNAAKQCAAIADNAKAGELVLVLVSGGGSALIPYPVDSITLAEKVRTTDLLLASGANINQINCVRKHLSQLKGGGLCRLIVPADCHALILSDVIGDDLSTIASGPTVADETTFAQAIEILKSKNIWNAVPDSVCGILRRGQQGYIPETPKKNDTCFARAGQTLVGSNRISVNAVVKSAQELGFVAILYSDTLCGEAREAAERLVLFAKEQAGKYDKRIAIIAGGETTVTLKGNGRGGRNQEMAIAFAIHAQTHGLKANWVFLSGGTDGRDGPTEAAGALVDSGTMRRILDANLNPADMLADNDSNTALNASHDLLITGATGTNVADLQVLLLQN